MEIQDSIQCDSCNSILSHPIDTCPVCGDQFYWLVTTKHKPSETEQELFLARMEELVEGRASRDFLNHDGHLWLPYRFWDRNPSGEVLEDYSWIKGVQLFQHDKEIEKEPDSEYDTLPKIPIPELLKEAQTAGLDTRATPHRHEREPHGRDEPLSSAANRKLPARAAEQTANPIIPEEMFVPLMIFLFFIFLSFSYLSLRYHKNHRLPVSQAVPEESHESSILP